jgi:hypothetical protein
LIIGFGQSDVDRKCLFEYAEVDGEEHGIAAKNINPYLVDARDVILASRARPLAAMAAVLESSEIAGGGYLLLNDQERETISTRARCRKMDQAIY